MPKRDIADFIAHWTGATASEQSISQQFLCELCDLLDVPQPGNQRNGAYTFEFHVSETQHDGTTREGRIDLHKRACCILESQKISEKDGSTHVSRSRTRSSPMISGLAPRGEKAEVRGGR